MLYLVRGLPGSGKSTFAHKIFPGIVHLENDMFHMVSMDDSINEVRYNFVQEKSIERVEQCFDIVRHLLIYKVPVVVTNVFCKKLTISEYVNIAKEYNVPYKIFRMMNTQFQNTHDVPEDVFQSMKRCFEDIEDEILVESIPNTNFNYKLIPPSNLQVILKPEGED